MLYVGPWERRPKHVCRGEFLDRAHPREMPELVRAALARPDNDFWTNNPYAVDAAEPCEVLVLTPSGPKRLDSHPEWDEWRDLLSTGEFWSLVGEDW